MFSSLFYDMNHHHCYHSQSRWLLYTLCLTFHSRPESHLQHKSVFIFPFAPIKCLSPYSAMRKAWELKHCKWQQPRTLRNKVYTHCSWTERRAKLPGSDCPAGVSLFIWINTKRHFWDGVHTSNQTLICLGIYVKIVGNLILNWTEHELYKNYIMSNCFSHVDLRDLPL